MEPAKPLSFADLPPEILSLVFQYFVRDIRCYSALRSVNKTIHDLLSSEQITTSPRHPVCLMLNGIVLDELQRSNRFRVPMISSEKMAGGLGKGSVESSDLKKLVVPDITPPPRLTHLSLSDLRLEAAKHLSLLDQAHIGDALSRLVPPVFKDETEKLLWEIRMSRMKLKMVLRAGFDPGTLTYRRRKKIYSFGDILECLRSERREERNLAYLVAISAVEKLMQTGLLPIALGLAGVVSSFLLIVREEASVTSSWLSLSLSLSWLSRFVALVPMFVATLLGGCMACLSLLLTVADSVCVRGVIRRTGGREVDRTHVSSSCAFVWSQLWELLTRALYTLVAIFVGIPIVSFSDSDPNSAWHEWWILFVVSKVIRGIGYVTIVQGVVAVFAGYSYMAAESSCGVAMALLAGGVSGAFAILYAFSTLCFLEGWVIWIRFRAVGDIVGCIVALIAMLMFFVGGGERIERVGATLIVAGGAWAILGFLKGLRPGFFRWGILWVSGCLQWVKHFRKLIKSNFWGTVRSVLAYSSLDTARGYRSVRRQIRKREYRFDRLDHSKFGCPQVNLRIW